MFQDEAKVIFMSMIFLSAMKYKKLCQYAICLKGISAIENANSLVHAFKYGGLIYFLRG